MTALKVDDFMLADQNFLAHQLHRLKAEKAVVLFSYANADAQVKRDAPALMALKAAGAEVWGIDSVLGEKRDAVAAGARGAGLNVPILFDYEQLVGEQLGVTRSAEVLVLNPRSWKVVYRGGVDGARAAVDALMAGKPVTMAAATQAKGSLIAFPEKWPHSGVRQDLLRALHRADDPAEVRHLPPARRHRPDAADQL